MNGGPRDAPRSRPRGARTIAAAVFLMVASVASAATAGAGVASLDPGVGAGVGVASTLPWTLELAVARGPDDGFSVQSRRGRLHLDRDRGLGGEPSLRITTDGTGAQVNVRRHLAPALDLRDRHLVVTLFVDDPRVLDRVDLYLSSDGFVGHQIYPVARQLVEGSQNPVRAAEWVAVPVPLGTPAVDVGSTDLSRISDIQVAVADSGERPVRVWIGSVQGVPRPPRGIVSVVFDDARDGVATLGRPVAERHGVRASVAVIRDLVGEPGFMSLPQLQALVDDLGWDVIGHHATELAAGFDALDDTALDAELHALRVWMLEEGFEAGADHVAYPLGRFDPRVLDVIRSTFRSARSIVPGHDTIPPADPHLIRSMSVTPRHDVGAVRREIDRAARDRTWLVLTFHQIVDREPRFETEYGAAAFEAVVRHLVAADVEVLTIPEVIGRPRPAVR